MARRCRRPRLEHIKPLFRNTNEMGNKIKFLITPDIIRKMLVRFDGNSRAIELLNKPSIEFFSPNVACVFSPLKCTICDRDIEFLSLFRTFFCKNRCQFFGCSIFRFTSGFYSIFHYLKQKMFIAVPFGFFFVR